MAINLPAAGMGWCDRRSRMYNEEIRSQGGREPVTDDVYRHAQMIWMHDPDRDKRPNDRKRDEHDWAIRTERDFF